MIISARETAGRRPLGIYVHIPYCVRKCLYCDFVSYPLKNDGLDKDRMAAYCSDICVEIRGKARSFNNKYYVDSIFFGGGTPSIAPARSVVSILSAIRDCFDVIKDVEISIEANPGTVNSTQLQAYADAGVNRLSLGVQSFNDDILRSLGRIHDSKTALEAFRAVSDIRTGYRKAFSRNIDLMFGVPGQTADIWKETLAQALELRPEHISFYSLQLEEGTPLYDAYRLGSLTLPSWKENRRMYHMAVNMLKSAGYHHYEISNAALPGHECRHNLKYWTMQDYLGFGTSAHSCVNGKRTGDDAPDPKGDFVFTELRLVDGFDPAVYYAMFGKRFEDDFDPAFSTLVNAGLLEKRGGRIRFTAEGLDYTNPVMEKLLNNTL
ncbi:MAG: radical SAM family heme chaperone HemW [Firmicutes bacterium]|nr:radical SAM family heme chaperone HemW [Bacillota bacterium]